MINAIVLIKTERQKINDVAEQLAAIDGVSEVYSVGGRYDLVAIIRAADNEALADIATRHIALVPGIADTETMIAFRAYSRHDLESMFSIGMGDA